MGITIGGFSQDIRTLIVNGEEKYRLHVEGAGVKYAKGWVDFNYNLIKDGSGNTIDYRSASSGTCWSNMYAFLEDGFYSYGNNKWTFQGSNLSSFNNLTSTAANFQGWFTAPKGGKQIKTIEDLKKYTNIFALSAKKTIPQVTLYAHWKIKTYTITVYNITRHTTDNSNGAFSSFYFRGRRVSSRYINLEVPYNTEAISYIYRVIQSPRYITWACRELDGTRLQQALRQGPQKFLGWHTSETGGGSQITYSYYVTNNISFYPKFQCIVIWPPVRWSDGACTGSGYRTYNPPMSLSVAKSDPPESSADSEHRGVWVYSADYFPLQSANTNVVSWRQT